MSFREGSAERTEEATARARAYELLALAFSPPSAELAEVASNPDIPVELPGLDPQALTPEYHRLFVGPSSLPAPPYESVYREEWRVMGETTLDVRRRYEDAGYALDPSHHELPDHVAVELAFMALLAEEEAKAWETHDIVAAFQWLRRERAFLDDHLTRWLPAFCDRLFASTTVAFYRNLAVALREFVTLDDDRIKALTMLLEEIRA